MPAPSSRPQRAPSRRVRPLLFLAACALAAAALSASACGGGGGGAAPAPSGNWDELRWNEGSWQ